MGALLSLFREHVEINGRSFEVLRQIGEGGFSVVLYVRDIATLERYALKAMPLTIPERVQEFKHEVAMYKQFSGAEYIGRLVDSAIVGEGNERRGLMLMTMYRGGSMQQFIEDGRHLDPPTAVPALLKTFRCVARALRTMHRAEPPIAYRDLKPGNILLTNNDTAVLIDLGSAAVARPDLSTRKQAAVLQELCAVQCTAPFRAPELFEPGALDVVVSEKSDIWSFGCTLYACMYGQAPFDGSATAATSGKFSIPRLPLPYPDALVDLITRCLAVPPADRPDIDQVLDALEKL